MRKRIIGLDQTSDSLGPDGSWIDLSQIATVEVTSEDPGFPIEYALTTGGGRGWRGSETGEQKVRLIFDHPISVRLVQLHFVESERERTQQFTLRWSSGKGGPPKEIVRQQWNFSPSGSTSEIEDYEVDLREVSGLELVITPDVSHHVATATLAAWRVA